MSSIACCSWRETYPRLDGDRCNLLHNIHWGKHVNQSLVDAHLEPVPSCGTLTTWRFTGGVPQALGGHPHWTFHRQPLVTSTFDEIIADTLKVLHLPACERDTDSLHLLCSFFLLLLRWFVCHCFSAEEKEDSSHASSLFGITSLVRERKGTNVKEVGGPRPRDFARISVYSCMHKPGAKERDYSSRQREELADESMYERTAGMI